MNVLSLFDGMSCGQLALNKAGIQYNNYYASEIDAHAIKVTKHNFPKTIHLGDVKNIDTSTLPKIDLLIGGSPCQSFSTAGKGEGFNGKSGLFWEYARILKEIKPTYFLLENVKMKKEWRDIISNELGVQPIEINSKLVSAQNRPRLYWTNIPNVTQPHDRGILLKHILEQQADPKYALSQAKIDRVLNTVRGRGFFYDGTQDKCGTLIAGYYKQPTDGIYIDLGFKRRLTPVECERLQTVPDNYTNIVADSHRYKMVGNGWTIDVIAHILQNCATAHMEDSMTAQNDELLVQKWTESGLLDATADKVQLAKVLEDISVQCFSRLSKGDVTREQIGKVALYAFPLATRVLANRNYQLVSNDGNFNTESVYVNTSATNDDDEIAAVVSAASQLNERISKYNNLQIAAFRVGPHEQGFVAEIVCR